MLIDGALTSKSRAIVGKAVARIVASSCSMNMALATMSAIVRKLRRTGAASARPRVDDGTDMKIETNASRAATSRAAGRRDTFDGDRKGDIRFEAVFGHPCPDHKITPRASLR